MNAYWFTTWRWGRVAAALLVVGMVLKLTMSADKVDRSRDGSAHRFEAKLEAKSVGSAVRRP